MVLGCFFHQFRVVCSNLSVDKKMNTNNTLSLGCCSPFVPRGDLRIPLRSRSQKTAGETQTVCKKTSTFKWCHSIYQLLAYVVSVVLFQQTNFVVSPREDSSHQPAMKVKVLPHERFRLVDDDVHLDVPLTLRCSAGFLGQS